MSVYRCKAFLRPKPFGSILNLRPCPESLQLGDLRGSFPLPGPSGKPSKLRVERQAAENRCEEQDKTLGHDRLLLGSELYQPPTCAEKDEAGGWAEDDNWRKQACLLKKSLS